VRKNGNKLDQGLRRERGTFHLGTENFSTNQSLTYGLCNVEFLKPKTKIK